MIALVFSMQGIGNLDAAIVTIVLLAIFKDAINADVYNLDYVWRLCIGLGTIPAVATVYLRCTMPESPRYNLNVNHDVEQAAAAIAIKGEMLTEAALNAAHHHDMNFLNPQKRNHWK
jgi:hypothetical protein